MKKEKIKALLNEMAEREFDIDEITEVFIDTDAFLTQRKAWIKETDPEYKQFYKKTMETNGKWLLETLEKYSLDYTLEDFTA